MKQVFYKGLLALTIAFGMTSCDKNDVGSENLQMTQSEVKAGLASKVTFSESGIGIIIPKLKEGNASAAKTASVFNHIYSSSASQTLNITRGDENVYSGSYDAGDISSLDPSSIILGNGSYSALSGNTSNQSEAVVLGFLPYTSAVNFDLSASATIQLAATLERGFLIVNAQAEAADGNRVTSATVNGSSLIGPDAEGDFYGYLLAGNHDIVVTYTLDEVATEVTGSQDVAIGSAYTINLALQVEGPDDIISSRTATETLSSNEADLGEAIEGVAPGRDINGDTDMIDDVERLSTTIFPTLNGEDSGVGVTTLGSWSVSEDFHVVTPQDGDTTPIDGGDGSLPADSSDDAGDDDDDSAPIDAGVDTITYDGVFVINDDRTEGASTGTVWVFGGADFASLALAQAAADLTGTSLDVNIIERESFADDTYTETQGFSVAVVDIVDDPAPVADPATLTQDGTEANVDVDVDVSYTTTAAPVAATWGDVDGVWSNLDYIGYSFTVTSFVDVDFATRYFYTVVVPSGANAIAAATLDTSDGAIAAAQLAIASN